MTNTYWQLKDLIGTVWGDMGEISGPSEGIAAAYGRNLSESLIHYRSIAHRRELSLRICWALKFPSFSFVIQWIPETTVLYWIQRHRPTMWLLHQIHDHPRDPNATHDLPSLHLLWTLLSILFSFCCLPHQNHDFLTAFGIDPRIACYTTATHQHEVLARRTAHRQWSTK